MRTLLAFLAATAALSVAGCADEATDKSTGGSSPETQATTTKNKPDCEKASRKLLNAIASGLEVSGGKGRLSRGYVVKSGDFSKVYMVAAEIDGPGLGDRGDVGVWATNSRSADGMIFAVDPVAQEFSDWGDGDQTDAQIDQSADGVSQAEECAEG